MYIYECMHVNTANASFSLYSLMYVYIPVVNVNLCIYTYVCTHITMTNVIHARVHVCNIKANVTYTCTVHGYIYQCG